MVISNRTLERLKVHHIILTQYYGLVIDTVPKLRDMVWALNHFNLKDWSRCIYWEDFLFIDEEMLNWIIDETGDYKMDCSVKRSFPQEELDDDDPIWDETSVADREVMEWMIKDVSWMYQEVETFSWKEHIKTLKLNLKNGDVRRGVVVSEQWCGEYEALVARREEEEFLKSFSDYLLENEENYFIFEYQLRYKLSDYLTELRNKKIENIIYE